MRPPRMVRSVPKPGAPMAALNPDRQANDPWPCTCRHPRYQHAIPTPEPCLVCPCSAYYPAEEDAHASP